MKVTLVRTVLAVISCVLISAMPASPATIKTFSMRGSREASKGRGLVDDDLWTLEDPYRIENSAMLLSIGDGYTDTTLRTIFEEQQNNEVLIHTYNGYWVRNVYLPPPEELEVGSKFKITVGSQWYVTILYSYGGGAEISKRVNRGEELFMIVFEVDGVASWLTEDELASEEPPYYLDDNIWTLMGPQRIITSAGLLSIGDDSTGTNLRTIFQEQQNNEVLVRSRNGHWVRNIYLPSADSIEVGSKILISCHSQWYLTILYTNGRGPEISKRVNRYEELFLIVFNVDGRASWLTEDEYNLTTDAPTSSPTNSPTESPTIGPTTSPTMDPTDAPTSSPTSSPTDAPTSSPTSTPTESHEKDDKEKEDKEKEEKEK